jgi:putative salt-induced outer membrane protein
VAISVQEKVTVPFLINENDKEVEMKGFGALAFGLCAALAAGSAAADWSGKGKIGGVFSRGNTETTSANAIIDLENSLDRWKHKFGGTLLRALDQEETTADRWELRAESEYTPTDRVFTWLSSRYENDRFTTYAYQATAATGLGYHFFLREGTKLDAKLGVGARRAEIRLTDEIEAEHIFRGSIDFEHKLTGNTLVFNRYLVEHGPTNTFSQNMLGIEVKMTAALGLGLTWEIRRNTEVLPGTRNSDQVFTAGLVIGF